MTKNADGLDNAQSGFVLVTVLVMLAVITGIIGVAVRVTTLDVRSERLLYERLRAQMFVDGVVRYVAWDLARRQTASPAFSRGGTWTCSHRLGEIQVAVQPVQGLVDLNAASPVLLERLITGVGETPERAQRVAAAIADFRDADDQQRANGAEEKSYIAAGREAGPKNEPFAIVAELDQVLGMDLDLLQRLRPYVTVASGLPRVDRESAPKRLVQMLSKTASHSKNNDGEFRGSFATRALRVSGGINRGDTTTAGRSMTIALDARAQQGYRILTWSPTYSRRLGVSRDKIGCPRPITVSQSDPNESEKLAKTSYQNSILF